MIYRLNEHFIDFKHWLFIVFLIITPLFQCMNFTSPIWAWFNFTVYLLTLLSFDLLFQIIPDRICSTFYQKNSTKLFFYKYNSAIWHDIIIWSRWAKFALTPIDVHKWNEFIFQLGCLRCAIYQKIFSEIILIKKHKIITRI